MEYYNADDYCWYEFIAGIMCVKSWNRRMVLWLYILIYAWILHSTLKSRNVARRTYSFQRLEIINKLIYHRLWVLDINHGRHHPWLRRKTGISLLLVGWRKKWERSFPDSEQKPYGFITIIQQFRMLSTTTMRVERCLLIFTKIFALVIIIIIVYLGVLALRLA